MKSPQNREGPGIIEYLLLTVIVVLFLLIISKLFGPAISNFIQDFFKNV
jgi:F0F1-type ATP synthase membrane subunit b/b'